MTKEQATSVWTFALQYLASLNVSGNSNAALDPVLLPILSLTHSLLQFDYPPGSDDNKVGDSKENEMIVAMSEEEKQLEMLNEEGAVSKDSRLSQLAIFVVQILTIKLQRPEDMTS